MAEPLERRTSLERLTAHAGRLTERMQAARENIARPVPSAVQKQQMDAVDSMCFLAPVNSRHSARAARGTRQTTTSISAELAQWLMVVLTGIMAAGLVTVLGAASKWLLERKLHLVHVAYEQHGLAASWAVNSGLSLGIVSVAIACAMLAPHAKGSGLPALIAYCNGCKLKGFTSKRTLLAKLIGTTFSLASGLCVGPEGPIITSTPCDPWGG